MQNMEKLEFNIIMNDLAFINTPLILEKYSMFT